MPFAYQVLLQDFRWRWSWWKFTFLVLVSILDLFFIYSADNSGSGWNFTISKITGNATLLWMYSCAIGIFFFSSSQSLLDEKIGPIRLLPIAPQGVGRMLWFFHVCIPLAVALSSLLIPAALIALVSFIGGNEIISLARCIDGLTLLAVMLSTIAIPMGASSTYKYAEFPIRRVHYGPWLLGVLVTVPGLLISSQQAALLTGTPTDHMLLPALISDESVRIFAAIFPVVAIFVLIFGIGMVGNACSGWKDNGIGKNQSKSPRFNFLPNLRGWWALLPVQQWIISCVTFLVLYFIFGAYAYRNLYDPPTDAFLFFRAYPAALDACWAWLLAVWIGWNVNVSARRVVAGLPVSPATMTTSIIAGNIITVIGPVFLIMAFQKWASWEGISAFLTKIMVLIVVALNVRADRLYCIPRRPRWALWVSNIILFFTLVLFLPNIATAIVEKSRDSLRNMMPGTADTYIVGPINLATDTIVSWSLPLAVMACVSMTILTWRWIYASLTEYPTVVPDDVKLSWQAEAK